MSTHSDSIIQLNSISINNSTTCGYCGSRKSQKFWVTSGFYCYKMSLNHYQQLLDRGWRRCGVFYYRPNLNQSCCSAFAVRLDTEQYELRVAHQKVLRRIKGIKAIEEQVQQEKDQMQNQDLAAEVKSKIQTDIDLSNLTIIPGTYVTYKALSLNETAFATEFQQIFKYHLQNVEYNKVCQKLGIDDIDFVVGLYQTTLHEFQAYELQIFRGSLTDVQHNWTFGCNFISIFYNRAKQKYKTIKNLDQNQGFQDLIIQMLSKSGLTFKISQDDGQILVTSEETLKHKKVKCQILYYLQKMPKKAPIIQQEKREIKVEWVKAQFEMDSFELYKKYQHIIHNKVIVSKQNYINFLCQDALEDKEGSIIQEQNHTKCWHMKYYLRDKLIAVGVVDILQESLSSVYFFYDPSYRRYSLGVYGALNEIEYIRQCKHLRYYYMGYFIQDCQKMAYKAEYKNCQILCPITYEWVPLTKEIRNLISKGEVKLSDKEIKQEEGTINELVRILFYNKYYSIQQLNKSYAAYFSGILEALLPLIGTQLMSEFVFQTK